MKNETYPLSTLLDAIFQDEEVSIPLLYRLSDLSAEDIERFWQRWPDVAAERRRVIARHMADIAEEDYVVDFVPYFKHFLQDETVPVKLAALDGIWDATDTTLVAPIIQMMQTDESVEVRTAAAAALAHYVLMSEWGQLSPHVTPRIVTALLAVYEGEDTAVSVKRAALEAMSPANDPRIPQLIEEAYQSRLPEVRLSAVFAMGSNADTRWMPTILQELTSPDPEMRAEAARAAGFIGSSDAVEQLAELTQEDDTDIALVAVTSLGQIGSEEARDILTALLEDDEYEALHEAIEEALEELMWMSHEMELLHAGDEEDDDQVIA
jgi:HEAT repeat protein